jgi:hypothetical protein
MRLNLVLFLFAIGAVSVGAEDKVKLEEFTTNIGRFKVLLPGLPKKSEIDTESDFGKGVLHMYTVGVNKTMYGVNYADYPAKIKKVSIKQVFDSSRTGAVANLKGKLSSEKDIKLGDHPGREIQIEVAGKRLFRVRVYLVGQRLYQVVVFGTKEAATSKLADRFLDSFKLVGKRG